MPEQARSGTAAQWARENPTVGFGALAFESDTNSVKVGDGVSSYGQLPYSAYRLPRVAWDAVDQGFVSWSFDPAVTDDVFKRILTWHFYKGDGKNFSVRWLKRRIWRFLQGANGTDFDDIDILPKHPSHIDQADHDRDLN